MTFCQRNQGLVGSYENFYGWRQWWIIWSRNIVEISKLLYDGDNLTISKLFKQLCSWWVICIQISATSNHSPEPQHTTRNGAAPGTSTKESAKRMNSALALRSSGVAIATKVMSCSEPNLGDADDVHWENHRTINNCPKTEEFLKKRRQWPNCGLFMLQKNA